MKKEIFQRALSGQHIEVWNEMSLLTLQETAEYLKVSKSFLYKLTSKKEIPFYKPTGKLIYFNKLEVDQWIKDGKVKTSEETTENLINNLKQRNYGRRVI